MRRGDPLRVVIDAGVLRDGRGAAGIGRYTRSLCAALERVEGVEVRLSIPAPPRSEHRALRHLHAQPRLLICALRARPTLVHSVASEAAVVWPLRRQVVTVHDVVAWASPQPSREARAYLAVEAWRLRRCAAVIAVSPRVARDAVAVLGLSPERVATVSEGVAPVFQAAPRADDVERRVRLGAAGDPYVLWTGTMRAPDPRKALDVLLEAMARVRTAVPRVALVLAGQGGPEAERVRRRAAALGVVAVMPGFVDDADLAALHRGAAASVVPSLDEGFGLPALEAMACGAPLVSTSAGNLADLVADAGLLVPPGSPERLAAGLLAVLEGGAAPELRRRGPGRAAAFTWDRAARETVAVYRAASARRRAGARPGGGYPAPL